MHTTIAIAIATALAPTLARADEPAPASDRIDDLDARQEEFDRRMKALEAERAEMSATRMRVAELSRSISAYIDVGAFVVAGNGAGIRNDFFHKHYPQYAGVVAGQWVFMGDPFSTAINSFGESADTADSREVAGDAIRSGGRPSVLVNSVGLLLTKDLTIKSERERTNVFGVRALAQLLPRPGRDSIDVPFAYVVYRPLEERSVLQIAVGKIDPVLGVEYRAQEPYARLGVTPSLICRYICYRPLGASIRYDREPWNLSAAVTNGDNFDPKFAPDDRLKSHSLAMVSAHAMWRAPIGKGLWFGVSGAYGPQDGQSELGVRQWHYGFDVKLVELDRWQFTGEFVHGKQPGDGMSGRCDVASCLRYKGGYLIVDRLVNDWFTPYVRLDWRRATHQQGADFVYEASTVRSTVGARFSLGDRVQAKVEYTFIRETDIPSFPHDVLTTSLVVRTEK